MHRHGALTGSLVTALLAVCAGAAGGLGPGAPPEDRLDLLQVDRRILAVDGRGGTVREASLELGERVLGLHSRGLVAVAVTNVRLLGVNADSTGFKELRYRLAERQIPPDRVSIGDRVAVVRLGTRLAALGASSRSWAQLGLGPHEVSRAAQVDANLALVVTDRRVVGFSTRSGGFVELPLAPNEVIESTSLEADSVTVVTEHRVLLFRSGAERWIQLVRKNRR